MSQSGTFGGGGNSPLNVQTLTGNTGGAISPTANNINIVGDGTVVVDGDPALSELTIKVGNAVTTRYNADFGNALASANVLNIIGSNVITTLGLLNNITIRMVNGADGQLLIGGGTDPVWANITSADGTVVITSGPNTIDLSAPSTFTGDTGGPVSPLSNNLNILGGNGVVVTGNPLTNTLTLNASSTVATTYVTDDGNAEPDTNILNIIGDSVITTTGFLDTVTIDMVNGTDGQLLIGGGTEPVWADLTSTDGSVTITAGPNSIDLSSPSTGADSFTGNTGGPVAPIGGNINIVGDNVVTVAGDAITGTLTASLINGTNGQLIIGGGTEPAWASLTSTDGSVTITTGANSIDLSSPSAGANTLTGNTGGAVSPIGGNINVVGSNVVTVTGNPATGTLTTSLTNGTNGQLLIGGGSAPAWASLTSSDGSVTITPGANSINLQAAIPSGGITTLAGDSGTATGSTVTIGGGANINTSASGSTVTVAVTDRIDLPSTNSAKTQGVLSLGSCEFFSYTADTLQADSNIFIGKNMPSTTNIGFQSDLIAIGTNAMSGISSSDGLATAIAIGRNALQNGGSGIFVSPASNAIAIGTNAMQNGGAQEDIAIGRDAMLNSLNDSTAGDSIAIGVSAMSGSLAGGRDCIAIGRSAMANGKGPENIAIGPMAMFSSVTREGSIAIGYDSLGDSCGNYSIGIGYRAGDGTPTTSDNCIYIGSEGLSSDPSGTIRIGNRTGGNDSPTYIMGIRGVTTNNNDAVAVLIDSAGQLGTVSSSIRYKENVQTLGEDSAVLHKLRAVSFTYKDRPADRKEYGFIAEEVLEHIPDIVVYNKEGEPETIQYHKLYGLMVSEIQQNRKKIEALEQRLADLEARISS